jgi:aspartate-semialdehyde dehydrogenase
MQVSILGAAGMVGHKLAQRGRSVVYADAA